MRLCKLRWLLRKQRLLLRRGSRTLHRKHNPLFNYPYLCSPICIYSLLTVSAFPTLFGTTAIAEGTPTSINSNDTSDNSHDTNHNQHGNWYSRSSSARSTQAGLCYLARTQERSHHEMDDDNDDDQSSSDTTQSSSQSVKKEQEKVVSETEQSPLSSTSSINPQPWYKEFASVLDKHDPRKARKKSKKKSANHSSILASSNKDDSHSDSNSGSDIDGKSGTWFDQFAESLEGSIAGSPIMFDEDVMKQIKDKLKKTSDRDEELLSQLSSPTVTISPTELAFSPIVNEPWSLDSEPSTVHDVSLTTEEENSTILTSNSNEDFYQTSSLGESIIKRDENSVSVQRPRYFTSHKSAITDPTRIVEYEFAGRLSAVINAYKLAQVPSILLESDEEFKKENQFHSRTLITHDILDQKDGNDMNYHTEKLIFRVVLKPLEFLSGVPLLSSLANSLAIVAYEDWMVDMHNGRAECVITNETFRGAFAVDEFCVFEQVAEHKSVDIYKSLYVSTFVEFPSMMFYKYTDYSDTYISVIAKLANSHVCGGGPRRNHRSRNRSPSIGR